jgi:hypothetical protein
MTVEARWVGADTATRFFGDFAHPRATELVSVHSSRLQMTTGSKSSFKRMSVATFQKGPGCNAQWTSLESGEHLDSGLGHVLWRTRLE